MVALAASACGGPATVVQYRTDDGITIFADLELPRATDEPVSAAGAPLVVLAHQLHRDRRSWDPLVPSLVEAGFAVLALDHRSFGESTREVASPDELTGPQREALDLDLAAGIEAAARAAGTRGGAVDTTRIALVASGLSVTPAVRLASRNPFVRSLVLLSGGIQESEERYLQEHPDISILLVAAAGDASGVFAMKNHAKRLVGDNTHYFELGPASADGRADWRGTDGFTDDTGLAALIVWFLEENFAR